MRTFKAIDWTRSYTEQNRTKYKDAVYDNPPKLWKPPPLVFPYSPREKNDLQRLYCHIAGLERYEERERAAEENETLVNYNPPLCEGFYAFLENTTERCTSRETKQKGHSKSAWVERIGTEADVVKRLTEGYAVSLSFCERYLNTTRNKHNFGFASGMALDIDVFNVAGKAPEKPDPVYSLDALIKAYPLLSHFCRFLMPSAGYIEGQHWRGRGVIFFPKPITDYRVFQAFADRLCEALPCLPVNVTKNPIAEAFGNTHNAHLGRRFSPDTAKITEWITQAEGVVLEQAAEKKRERIKAEKKRAAAKAKGKDTSGENISNFIENANAVDLLVSEGLLSHNHGNEYHWHASETSRSCEVVNNGVLKIFSGTMAIHSPVDAEPVNAHRFYIYYHIQKDMKRDADKPAIRAWLFERGYGSDPSAFEKHITEKRVFEKSERENETEAVSLTHARQTLLTAMGEAFGLLTENGCDKKRVFFVAGAVGTGKTYAFLTGVRDTEGAGGILISGNAAQRDAQAEEAAGLFGSGDWIYSWKGRQTEFDQVRELPLVDRQHNESLFDKGVQCPVYEWHSRLKKAGVKNPCELCPLRSVCVQKGYLKQYSDLRERRVVCIALPDALDEGLGEFLSLVGERMFSEKVIVAIDDYTLDDLIVKGSLAKADLEKAIENRNEAWEVLEIDDDEIVDVEAVRLAHAFLEKLTQDCWGDFATLQKLIADTEPIAEGIETGLSLVVYGGRVFTVEAAYRRGMPISEIQAYLDLYDKLKRWVDDNDAETVLFDCDESTWDFFNKPTLRGIQNLLLMSGTTPVDLAKRLLPGERCDFHEITLPTPALAKGVKVLQYKDAKLTSESIFDVEYHRGEYKAVGLKTRASERIQRICGQVRCEKEKRKAKGLPHKALWVSLPDFCCDREGNPLNDVIFHSPEGVLIRETFDYVLHYRVAEGRNLEGLGIGVMFGYPKGRHEDVRNITSHTFKKRIPQAYDDATEIRTYESEGIKIRERVYKDKDAEAVRQALAGGLLNQAAGRLRPYGNENALLCLFTKAVTDVSRAAVLFTKADFDNANTLSEIEAVVSARETAEQSGDVHAYAAAADVSDRTARRKTAPKRKQNKAARDAEIRRRYADGETQQQIAEALGVSVRTVIRVLNAKK